MEVLLVHEDKAAIFLPRLEQVLVADRKEAGLEPIQFRLDSKSKSVLFQAKQLKHKTLIPSF